MLYLAHELVHKLISGETTDGFDKNVKDIKTKLNSLKITPNENLKNDLNFYWKNQKWNLSHWTEVAITQKFAKEIDQVKEKKRKEEEEKRKLEEEKRKKEEQERIKREEEQRKLEEEKKKQEEAENFKKMANELPKTNEEFMKIIGNDKGNVTSGIYSYLNKEGNLLEAVSNNTNLLAPEDRKNILMAVVDNMTFLLELTNKNIKEIAKDAQKKMQASFQTNITNLYNLITKLTEGSEEQENTVKLTEEERNKFTTLYSNIQALTKKVLGNESVLTPTKKQSSGLVSRFKNALSPSKKTPSKSRIQGASKDGK